VRTPTGEVVLDPTGRLAGRGAYLCADGSCWPQALAKGALQRALGSQLPSELRATLERGAVRTPGAGATIDGMNRSSGAASLQASAQPARLAGERESSGAASLQASAQPARLAGERKDIEGELFGQE
jgi:hypothetical protein